MKRQSAAGNVVLSWSLITYNGGWVSAVHPSVQSLRLDVFDLFLVYEVYISHL